jgi:hypothetical protein
MSWSWLLQAVFGGAGVRRVDAIPTERVAKKAPADEVQADKQQQQGDDDDTK